MKKYLIVGGGIAGLSVASALAKRHIAFVMVDDPQPVKATAVAAGLLNPIVLKRLNPVWQAAEFARTASGFYRDLEKQLGAGLYREATIKRLFSKIKEQNDWLHASDRPFLEDYLDSAIDFEPQAFKAPFGLGTTRHTARIHTPELIDAFQSQLCDQGCLRAEALDFQALEVGKTALTYRCESFDQVIFCEGHQLKANPYFQYLPLRATKGEYLRVHAGRAKLDFILKARYFFIPNPGGTITIGATYAHDDASPKPTEQARHLLLRAFEKTFGFTPEVRAQPVGIRPTVSDRRPLLGTHPTHRKLAVLNGLGTRGLLMAPQLAEALVAHLESGAPLAPQASIRRFDVLCDS